MKYGNDGTTFTATREYNGVYVACFTYNNYARATLNGSTLSPVISQDLSNSTRFRCFYISKLNTGDTLVISVANYYIMFENIEIP